MELDPRQLHVFTVPLRTRFRGLQNRDGVLIRGPVGWAEFSPFWDYSLAMCRPWLAAAREAADEGWPPPLRDRVPVNCTVPAVEPEQAVAIVRTSGCRTAKVKVAETSQPADADLERVRAVRDALGPDGQVRVDANGAWDVDTAVRQLRRLDLAAGGLEYAEQPCASVDELAKVRRRVDVPVAADESVRRSTDPDAVRRAGAADIVVLKAAPLGGVRATLALAERINLPVVVSSALETSVGLAAGVALAAALPALPFACGLGTARLLDRDLVLDPLLPVDGSLPVRRPAPDPTLLARSEAASPLRDRWVTRLRATQDNG